LLYRFVQLHHFSGDLQLETKYTLTQMKHQTSCAFNNVFGVFLSHCTFDRSTTFALTVTLLLSLRCNELQSSLSCSTAES